MFLGQGVLVLYSTSSFFFFRLKCNGFGVMLVKDYFFPDALIASVLEDA